MGGSFDEGLRSPDSAPPTDPGDPLPSTADVEPASVPGTAQPEGGLRTFLIADIRGYTTYTRERGDEAGAALAERFAKIVAEIVPARDGFLLELRGDEALVVFVSARKALRAALDLQARFAGPDGLDRGVGIGLDAGEAIPVGDGYRGTALNLAARLCAQAGPGETIASEAVIHLAAKVDGIAYVDARSLRLKGYDDAVRAVAVVTDEAAKGRRRATIAGRSPQPRLVALVTAGGLALVILAAALAGGFIGGLPAKSGPLSSGITGASQSPAGSVASGPAVESPGASGGPIAASSLPALALIDPATGAVVAAIPSSRSTGLSWFADGAFWALGDNPLALSRIDPGNHTVTRSIAIPVSTAQAFTIEGTSIWIVDGDRGRVVRIDLRSGVTTADLPIDAKASGGKLATDVGVGEGSIWLPIPDARRVLRIDQASGKVQAQIEDVDAEALGFGEGAAWYTGHGQVGRIDPRTNKPAKPTQLADVSLPAIAFGGGFAWVAETGQGIVWKVDRADRVVGTYKVGPGVGQLSFVDGTMWAANEVDGTLTGIDVVTGQTRRLETHHSAVGVAGGAGLLLVGVSASADDQIAAFGGSVLTIAAVLYPFHNPTTDPAINASFEFRQIGYLTCAGLLAYPDSPAPDGWRLQPEVAAALPTLSPDGLTYTYTIRPGFAFSPPSGEAVTAETYRATIERALSPRLVDWAPGFHFLGDIVGAAEYHAGKADHISGLSAGGDQLSVTLKAPAPDFPGRLTLPYFCPVPISTPIQQFGLESLDPIPSAGPYYIVAQGKVAILRVNPNYKGSRPKPFDTIAVRQGFSSAEAVAQVESHAADLVLSPAFDPILGVGSTIATAWGPASENAARGDQRWFGSPRFFTDYVALNPRRAPFNDATVREAVALALDRVALARAFGEAPMTGLLPPSVPGSIPMDVAVAPPDLAAARALIDGRHFKATLAIPPDCAECEDFAGQIVGDLGSIGIAVTVKRIADPAIAREQADIIEEFSQSDFGDPVSVLGDVGVSGWIGRSEVDELARLMTLDGQARTDGAVAFAERLTTAKHLVVPFAYPVYALYLGDRIGCGFVQPAIGAVDLASLCLKSGSPSPSSSPAP